MQHFNIMVNIYFSCAQIVYEIKKLANFVFHIIYMGLPFLLDLFSIHNYSELIAA